MDKGAYAQWELDLKSRDLQIGLDRTSCYTVVLFDMDPLPEEEHRFQEKDSGLLQFSLKSIAGEIIYDHNGGVFQDEQGRCVVLFQSSEEEEEEEEGEFKLRIGYSVAKVLTTVKEILKLTASAGISGTGIGGDAVPLLYGQAKDSLQKRVMYGRDIAIPYSEEQDVSDKVTLPSSAERELEIGIETGNLAKAEAAVLQLAELSLDQAGTVEEAQVCVLHLFHLFFQIAKSNNWAIQEAAGEDFIYFGSLQSLQTREQVIGCLVRIARSLANFALEKSQAKGAEPSSFRAFSIRWRRRSIRTSACMR
ncbi:hypothetical protein N6H14_27875 [Paenibacillus sp. CC-CFT747]|nr:hypothetical protein N6H14_27875 [Paenibacillus sp. CC-CFT747]